jgi:hypothetical protein
MRLQFYDSKCYLIRDMMKNGNCEQNTEHMELMTD